MPPPAPSHLPASARDGPARDPLCDPVRRKDCPAEIVGTGQEPSLPDQGTGPVRRYLQILQAIFQRPLAPLRGLGGNEAKRCGQRVDPNPLRTREFVATANHPSIGERAHTLPFFTFNGERRRLERTASTLGQDNAYVQGHLLWLSEAELSELESEGLIGDRFLEAR